MEMSRYSIKPNAGKGLSGFITNFDVASEFDPAWLDSNLTELHQGQVRDLSQRPSMVGFKLSLAEHSQRHKQCQRPSMVGFKPDFLGADLPIKTHAELRFQR